MAPGSNKKQGAFFLSTPNINKIVLCESAIDAISYFAIDPCGLCVSTSGANSHPVWLSHTIQKGYEVFCAFDADDTGDYLANKMIQQFPTIKRLRPPLHDWNAVLSKSMQS